MAGNAVVSRLLIQNIRHQWLSLVYNEILSHGTGNELFLKEFPELEGACFEQLESRFVQAVPLGLLRKQDGELNPMLNPPGDLRLQAGDRLVFLSRSYTDIIPLPSELPSYSPRQKPARNFQTKRSRYVLFLGWNDRMPHLIQELDQFETENFRLDILSRVPAADRIDQVGRYKSNPKRVSLAHLEGDYLVPSDLWDLNLVFSELFGSGGAEIYFKPSRVYGLNGHELQFGQIQQTVIRQGDIALGICLGPEGSGSRPVLQLNPNREASWSLQAKDAIVVLTTLASPESGEMS
ncbi:MAG: hypothetical protein K9J81_03840 [Desulfohalobiaceae bacterium]|nr:hypothetical protein [Desulfohalobiaceae bacterium]